MSMMSLQPATLKALQALAKNPSAPLPAALLALDKDGPWDLLTQRVRSDQVKILADKAEFVLPLLDKSASDSGKVSGQWAWSASVELNAKLSIDLLASDDPAGLGVQPDAGHTLVAYGASLAVGGSVGVKSTALAWGSLAASAGGKISPSVRWFVQAKDDGTVLDSLESAQKYFVSPHDLAAMLRLANRSDWFGLEMKLDGEANLSLEASAKAAGTGWTFNIDGKESSVGLSVGLDASFTAQKKSTWQLRATAVPLAGVSHRLGLRVALHDLKQGERDAALSFSAGADFSAVMASAERVLRAAWPELDNDLLDQLSRPGTALGSKLAGLIDSKLDGTLKDVATLLSGGGGGDELKATLVDKLTGTLAEELDGALGTISEGKADVNALLDGWLKRLLGPAAAAVTVDDDLKALVAKALGDATKGLEQGIKTLKDRIVGQTQEKVGAVLKPLGELGAQFEGALAKLDDAPAAKAIRKAIQRYADLREKLLGELTKASRQKVMLTLTGEWKRETRDEAVVEVVFVPPPQGETLPPEAELLYHALCSGRLLALPQLVVAATRVGVVASASGWLLSSAKTLESQRAMLNFFGIEIGASTSWLREVEVKTDLVTGDLMAARGSMSVETAISNRWKNRKAWLGLQLELTGGQGAAPVLGATLSGAFAAMAGDFANRKTVQELLDTYARSTDSPRTDIERMLVVPTGDEAKKFWRNLTLALPVSLDADQWRTFAKTDADVVDAVALEVALALFERRYRSDNLFSKDPVADLAGYAAGCFEERGLPNPGMLAYLKLFPEGWVSRFSASSEAIKLGIPAVVSGGSLDRGGRIFMALHRLSATVQAPRRLQLLAQQAGERVRSAPAPVDPKALRKSIDGLLQKMQQALSPVALVSETFLGIGVGGAEDEPISWPFTSFITTMAKLSGMDVPPGFVPVAQVGDQPPVKLLPPA